MRGFVVLFLALIFSSLAFGDTLSSLKLLSEVQALSSKAISLGDMAKGKLTTPALKSFNDRMIEDHQVSGANLKEMVTKYSLNLPTDSIQSEDLSSLKKLSGDKFEKQYLKEGLNLHTKLLDLLKDKVLPATDNAAVKGMLKNYIPRVSTLVDSLQSLKAREE